MLDESSVEGGDVAEEPRHPALAGPTEQHGVDDEEGEHPAVLRGGRRPRRVVVEAQIPPEPGDCEIVGHRATLGTRSREPRVGR